MAIYGAAILAVYLSSHFWKWVDEVSLTAPAWIANGLIAFKYAFFMGIVIYSVGLVDELHYPMQADTAVWVVGGGVVLSVFIAVIQRRKE